MRLFAIIFALASFTAEAYADAAPRAMRTLPLGHVVSFEDLSAADATQLAFYVGRQTRLTVPQGTALRPEYVAPKIAFYRNSVVDVTFRRGGLEMRISAKVLRDAHAGQWVELMNLKTRKKFQGEVQSDGTILVR